MLIEKKKKVKECKHVLEKIINATENLIKANGMVADISQKNHDDVKSDDYIQLYNLSNTISIDIHKLHKKSGTCNYEFNSDNLKELLKTYYKNIERLKKLLWASFTHKRKHHIRRELKQENFQNKNEVSNSFNNNLIEEFANSFKIMVEQFNVSLKPEIEEEMREDTNNQDVIEGFETVGQVRKVLNKYYDDYKDGNFLGLNPASAPENTFNYLNKNQLDPYTGNTYYSSGIVGQPDINQEDIAYNVRRRAISEYLPYTMRRCHQQWTDIDNIPNETDYLTRINDTEIYQNYSKQRKSYNVDESAVNYTKTYGLFWSDATNSWISKETVENASNCNGIYDNQVKDNTVPSSNLTDYIGNAQEIELQRKQILAARANIYKNMTGVDSRKMVNEPQAICPTVVDQDSKEITQWTRADDSLQAGVCLSKNSFADDRSKHYVRGKMKSGKIIGTNDKGDDMWLENVNNLENSRKIYTNLMDSNEPYNYKLRRGKDVINNPIDPMNIDLLRLSGNSVQRSLQDRDWSKSTYKWNHNLKVRRTNNQEYFIDHYLPLLMNTEIPNSNIYRFKLHYKDNSKRKFKSENNILSIIDNNEIISHIHIISQDNLPGIVRVYKNEYQYSDYISDSTNSHLGLPSIKGISTKAIAIQYNILSWQLDEMINYGYDLYIICSNLNKKNDLYNTENGFLCYHNKSQFEKCYYSKKQDNPGLLYHWTIVPNNTLGGYLILNKDSKKFLAFGINYRNRVNWDISNHGAVNRFGLSLDSNKETRNPVLYYVSMDDISFSKSQGASYYTNLLKDLTWFIEQVNNNRFSITHYTNATLWFTSNTYQEKFNDPVGGINKTNKPFYQNLGYVGCTINSGEEESNVEKIYCDKLSNMDCYNKYFYIVPKEPNDISHKFQLRDYRQENKKNEINWYKALRPECSKRQGNKLNTENTWFRTINNNFKVTYADHNQDTGKIDTEGNKLSKMYSNIYERHNNKDQVITSLGGGGGWNCSKSNYCHVDREVLSKDRDTGRPNPVYQKNSGPLNSQDDSNQITLSYRDRDNNLENQVYNQPINRYHYKCIRNEFGTFKIYNNQKSVGFTQKLDPNILTGKDDPDNITKDKKVAVHIFSYDSDYKEGRDFGMALNGNYIWFRNNVDLSQIGFYELNERQLLKTYITLKNNNMSSQSKHAKIQFLHWYDKLRFHNIGFRRFKHNKVYSYSNMYAGTNKFNNVFIPKESE